MKFKFGDTVILKDDFARYEGRVVTHRYKREWTTLWLFKVSWYEVEIYDINGERAMGMAYFPEKSLELAEDPNKPKRKSGKVTKLHPKK